MMDIDHEFKFEVQLSELAVTLRQQDEIIYRVMNIGKYLQ